MEWRVSLTGEIEPGRLELRIPVQRVESLVAPEPGLLEPAERHRDVRGVERVHPHRARSQAAGQSMGALHVAGPDPGREPEWRVVRDPQAVLLVVELDDRQDRSEDLLARHPHPVVDPVENRRWDVVTAG